VESARGCAPEDNCPENSRPLSGKDLCKTGGCRKSGSEPPHSKTSSYLVRIVATELWKVKRNLGEMPSANCVRPGDYRFGQFL
jgi:hypothetical protein